MQTYWPNAHKRENQELGRLLRTCRLMNTAIITWRKDKAIAMNYVASPSYGMIDPSKTVFVLNINKAFRKRDESKWRWPKHSVPGDPGDRAVQHVKVTIEHLDDIGERRHEDEIATCLSRLSMLPNLKKLDIRIHGSIDRSLLVWAKVREKEHSLFWKTRDAAHAIGGRLEEEETDVYEVNSGKEQDLEEEKEHEMEKRSKDFDWTSWSPLTISLPSHKGKRNGMSAVSTEFFTNNDIKINLFGHIKNQSSPETLLRTWKTDNPNQFPTPSRERFTALQGKYCSCPVKHFALNMHRTKDAWKAKFKPAAEQGYAQITRSSTKRTREDDEEHGDSTIPGVKRAKGSEEDEEDKEGFEFEDCL